MRGWRSESTFGWHASAFRCRAIPKEAKPALPDCFTPQEVTTALMDAPR